ncbi:MAG: hypothetical protein V3U32_03305 [Anaerolineales bacterium]
MTNDGKTMEITDFERVAASLTIRSIYTELGPDVPVSSDIGTASEIMTEIDADPTNAPARVIASDSSTLGMVWYEELDADAGNVNEVMERLTPSDFLPADTTILDAFDLFCSKGNNYFYLLEKNEVIGVLLFSDLFKPLGRLAFLALALEIEQLALKLCQLHGVSQACLSGSRRIHPSEGVAQEVELPFRDLADSCLLFADCEFQPARELAQSPQGLFGVAPSAQDHEIVGIAHAPEGLEPGSHRIFGAGVIWGAGCARWASCGVDFRIEAGSLFRRINRADRVLAARLSGQGIATAIKRGRSRRARFGYARRAFPAGWLRDRGGAARRDRLPDHGDHAHRSTESLKGYIRPAADGERGAIRLL